MTWSKAVRIVLVAAGATILLAVSAGAEQMDARDPPEASEPLALESEAECGRQVNKDDAGTIRAVVRTCLYFYAFDPAMESDASSDYGVVWLQSNVNAQNGWCAAVVNSDLTLPPDIAHYAYAPDTTVSTDRRRFYTTKLEVDAYGNATSAATVRQMFLLFPKELRPSCCAEVSKGNRFRLHWEGSSPRKLGFASGIEIAWDVVAGPPESFGYGVKYSLEQRRGC